MGYEKPGTPPRPDEWGAMDRMVDQSAEDAAHFRKLEMERQRRQAGLLAEQVSSRSELRSARASVTNRGMIFTQPFLLNMVVLMPNLLWFRAAEKSSDRRWAEEETYAYEAQVRTEKEQAMRLREQERAARVEGQEMSQARQLTERERQVVRSHAIPGQQMPFGAAKNWPPWLLAAN